MDKCILSAGIRIRLVRMEDPYPLPPGTTGTIIGRDDIGDYIVDWDNGSHLKLVPAIDQWEVLNP